METPSRGPYVFWYDACSTYAYREDKMFEEKIERKDLAKMPAEYIELLGRVLTIQADCEIGGPHLYVKDILLTAPTKVNQLIVARTAAEEMDHYRKIARLLAI